MKQVLKRLFFFLLSPIIYSKYNDKYIHLTFDDGHEVGNHSFSHVDFKKKSFSQIINEITQTSKVLKESSGLDVKK